MRALWAAVLCSTAGAQIYKFNEATVPESKSLSLGRFRVLGFRA